jgi:hypothetical protein
MHLNKRLLLLMALVYAISCKASDSLFNHFYNNAISISQYQAYRAQLHFTDSVPILKPSPIDEAIIIPDDLQPFIGPEEIQSVYLEVFEKKKSNLAYRLSTLSHQLVFWKGDNIGNTDRFTGHEDWGLLRNENASIWKKVGRGELLIGGAELLGMGILMMMPKEVTKWPEDWVADAGRNIKRAFTTAPVMDQDDWQMNYVGHPLAGALYYNTIRSQNATWFQSFLFSTAQSLIWEYVIEGIAEPPSIQDMIITPVAGTIFGEACHQLTMSMRNNGFNFVEKVVTLILNPMFVVNNGFGPKHNPTYYKK